MRALSSSAKTCIYRRGHVCRLVPSGLCLYKGTRILGWCSLDGGAAHERNHDQLALKKKQFVLESQTNKTTAAYKPADRRHP